MRDPYESLAVPRSATADDIKKSFRLLAKKLHPDTNKSDPKAAALFAELKAAHEILGDEAKRRAFDRGEIDAEGNPAPEAVRNVSGLTLSVTGLIVAMATLVASLLIMRNVLPLMGPNLNSAGEAGFLSRVSANEERAPAAQGRRGPRVWSDSRLLFPQSVSYLGPDTIPLGVQIDGETVGLALEISGLPSGATISTGRPIPGGGWRILAADLRKAMIYLPTGFSGQIDLAVQLRLFDDTVVDRGSLHFEWLQTDPIESASTTAASESAANKALAVAASTDQNATNTQRDPSELLIGRSEKLVSEGSVEAARLLLQPAAEAQDARAAIALGATYDPTMLAKLQVHGVASDVSMAIDWYKKAQDFGSPEARQRLKSLTTASVEPKKRVVRSSIHVVVSRIVAPRAAAPPRDPNAVSVAGERVAAVPDPSIHAQLARDDSRKLPTLFGVSY
jgi:hypothetical protein